MITCEKVPCQWNWVSMPENDKRQMPSWHLCLDKLNQALSFLLAEERPPQCIKSSEKNGQSGMIWGWIKYYMRLLKISVFFCLVHFNKWAPVSLKVSKCKYFPSVRMILYITFMMHSKRHLGQLRRIRWLHHIFWWFKLNMQRNSRFSCSAHKR